MSGTVLRVDVSPRIGTGHLRRCLELARRLNGRGIDTHFLVKSDGMDVRSHFSDLVGDYVPMDLLLSIADDAWCTTRYCDKVGADRLIVDHYEADEQYQRILLDAGLRWLQFDGLAQSPLWADWVVSMSPSADVARYRTLQRRPHTRLLLGPRHAIIRTDFDRWRERHRIPQRARNVLLTFGGGDDRGACIACLAALSHVDGFQLTILTSIHNPQVASIQSWLSRHPHVQARLVLDEPAIARYMAESDIAVVAGGTTTFEVATMGLPMLIVQIAQNQSANAAAWERIGNAVNLGPIDALDGRRLAAEVIALAQDQSRRERMAKAGQDCVDGRGAERIIDELYPVSDSHGQ